MNSTLNTITFFLGLRSYGKVVYLFFILKFTSFLIFAAKIIDVLPMATFKNWLLKTEWMEFIYNGEVYMYFIKKMLPCYNLKELRICRR